MPEYQKPQEQLEIKYLDLNLQDALFGYGQRIGLDGFPGDYNVEIFVDTAKNRVVYKWFVKKK